MTDLAVDIARFLASRPDGATVEEIARGVAARTFRVRHALRSDERFCGPVSLPGRDPRAKGWQLAAFAGTGRDGTHRPLGEAEAHVSGRGGRSPLDRADGASASSNGCRGSHSVADRDVLGIVWCPACKADTMPSEKTGCCFFCDTRLVAAEEHDAAAPEESTVAFCPECDTMFDLTRTNRLFCSKKCKNAAYYRTVKGQAFLAKKYARSHATLKATRVAAREAREAAAEHGSVARYTLGCRCPRCMGAWSQRHVAARLATG